MFFLSNDPCNENHFLSLFRKVYFLKFHIWEPWENLDLASEPPVEKVWEPLNYFKLCCTNIFDSY